jgi:hypothetical protein
MKFGTVHEFSLSPDGAHLAVLGAAVAVWDLHTQTRIWRRGVLSNPSHCCWSADGKLLTIKSTSGRMEVVDGATGDTHLLLRDKGHEGTPLHATGGTTFVHGTWSGSMEQWDAATGERLRTWTPDDGRVGGLQRVGDELWMTVWARLTSDPGASRVDRWEAVPGDGPIGFVVLPETAVSFVGSFDGRRVFISHRKSAPTLHHAHDLAPIPAFSWERATYVRGAWWSIDSATLILNQGDDLLLVDASSGEVLHEAPWEHVSTVWPRADGSVLVGAASGGVLRFGESLDAASDIDVATCAAVVAADRAGQLDEDAVEQALRTLLLKDTYDATTCMALAPPLRAWAVSNHMEHCLAWDGLGTTMGNFPDHLAMAPAAYEALGLPKVAAVFKEVDELFKFVMGMGPDDEPPAFDQGAWEARLNDAGIADGPAKRLAWFRVHHDVFAQVSGGQGRSDDAL